MNPAAADLIELARHVAKLRDPWAISMAGRLDRLIHGDEPDIERALELKPSPGQRHWRTELSGLLRDDLIKGWAREYYPDSHKTTQARAIHKSLSRYRATAWRTKCLASVCPHEENTERAIMWSLLRISERVPGERQLRRILAMS